MTAPKTLATLAVRSRKLRMSQLAELLRIQSDRGGDLLEHAIELGYMTEQDAREVREQHMQAQLAQAGQQTTRSSAVQALLHNATDQQPLVRFVTRHGPAPAHTKAGKELVNILLVDDEPANQELMTAHFEERGVENDLYVASDGEQALAMLRGSGGQAVPRPYVIVLDLHMPRMDGFEFLDELRADPEHQDAVVLVMTASLSEQDLLDAEQRDVAGYFVRDYSGEGFLRAMAELFNSYA